MPKPKPLVLNSFCQRQFNNSHSDVNIPMDMSDFLEKVNQAYYKNPNLRPGYADFCKHLIIENFTDAIQYYAPITQENEYLLKTAYIARKEYELPVLRRFFKKEEIKAPRAIYLDIILYSKKQIDLEEEELKKKNLNYTEEGLNTDKDYDWGIISIKPQDVDYEIPMDPITMMRNALGPEEGGSGVALDRNKYMQSVEFWSYNAVIN